MDLFDSTPEKAGGPPADSLCHSLGIPPYLHRMGRDADDDFAPGELLFRWYVPPRSLNEEGWIWTPMSGAMSVNRERYSGHPTDVLYDIRDGNHRFGRAEIAIFQVGELREIEVLHPTIGSKRYTLDMIHAPERCMYPHTNVQILLNGEPVSGETLPKTAKTEFRRKFTKIYRAYTTA